MSRELSASSSRLHQAVAFFGQPVWTRLMKKLYTKYIEQGQIRGQVILRQCTSEERQAMARFLGKSLSSSVDFPVHLVDFQQALMSSFACSLPDVLQELFPLQNHITRPQEKELQSLSQQAFERQLSALVEGLPVDSPGQSWLVWGKHGREALFRQHKNEAPATQEQILHMLCTIAEALNQLPTPPSFHSLSHFALQVSGDPHFLDGNTVSGRLFLTALIDLRELANPETPTHDSADYQQSSETRGNEPDHWRHLLYYEAGLLLDTISSTVAVFHLKDAQEKNGQSDALILHAGERIQVLPLRQLLNWKKLWPSAKNVYVFENPQVFEVIVDSLLQRLTERDEPTKPENMPTLICTSGWPSVAAIRLLTLLIESSPDVQLYYSGDFDLQGLRIARYLLSRYPQRCHLWRFDPAAYLTAVHSHGAVFAGKELAGLQNLPEIFSPLVKVMQQEQKKAYHEGITAELLQDIYEQNFRGE